MEIEPQHLKQLSRDINSTLGTHLGEFRKAATDGNKNVGNIAKDISKMFASQKRDMGNFHETLEETNQTSQRTATKIDNTNSILQESVALQNNILAEMKGMNGSLKMLNANIQNMNPNSIFDTVFNNSKFGRVLSGLELALGAGAVGALGYMGYQNVQDAERKNADTMASLGGGGGGGMGGGKAIAASGNLAQNQQEAYKAAVGEGLSEKSAKILVANMSGESLKNPGLKRWDRFHYSQGIVQWDDQRSAEIKKQFGKYPQEMSVAEQTKAAIWEMKSHKEFAKAWEGMTNERLSDQERMYAVVKHYEKPQYAEKDTGTRLSYLRGLKVGGGNNAVAQDATPQTKPEPTQQSEPQATQQDATPSGPMSHGHGIISGAIAKGQEEQQKSSTADKSALTGKSLDGVNKQLVDKLAGAAAEFKKRTGQAVDVTSGTRTPEKQAQLYQAYISGRSSIPANPPGKSNHETGNAVDVTSAQAREMDKMGILAQFGLARPLGEKDPVHIQLAGTGTSQASYGGGSGSGKSETTPASSTPDATPETKPAATPSMENTTAQDQAPPQAPDSEQHGNADQQKSFIQGLAGMGGGGMGGMGGGMGMPSGMMGMMGGMGGMGGGMGGMLGMLGPLLGGLGGMGGGMGGMAKLMSGGDQQASMNTAQLNASEVEKQLEESRTKEALVNHFRNQDKQSDERSVVQGNSAQLTVNDYNGPEDIGWPDWAKMLGGNHYEELKKIKLNMWG